MDAHSEAILSMGIAWISWRHRKALLPLGKKARLQEVIGGLDASDSGQTHFFHQAVLQGGKQPLDASPASRQLMKYIFAISISQGRLTYVRLAPITAAVVRTSAEGDSNRTEPFRRPAPRMAPGRCP